MPQPNPNSTLVAMVDTLGEDQMGQIIAQNAQIIALLTEIRDDQRAVQGDTVDGKVVRSKDIIGGLL